jgi:hypothetical protein
MRSKVKRAPVTARLERLIDALAMELAEASDEEVLQACADLGMNPHMRGSAAFIGLKGASVSDWRLEDFFDLQTLKRMQLAAAAWRGRSEARGDAEAGQPSRGRSLTGGTAKALEDEDAGKK